jgi:hypothetical protein
MKKCKHETLEVVEEEKDTVWMRCHKCFVLFKFSRAEFEKMEEVGV